ncbi:hypothetical protein M7I_4196 [Glarea lozoyensis 74030]|uniref:F-box domain-containing protein n=1 Tax=Glarea lozoyensis (strain ATCC 74030 / MF5533) TaxID=1104152 RepID=H0ENJ1_GLAL7|nr:hypothetical protein M7I_4196 [Glarea lozoyensis 74030]
MPPKPITMSNFKRAPQATPHHSSLLSTLKSTTMIESKPVLPAEIISRILDYLPIPDLLSFARTSKRMLEMVYEDSRWVQRLHAMGLWNEGEARKRFEEGMKRKREVMRKRHEEEAKRLGIGVQNGVGAQRKRRKDKGGARIAVPDREGPDARSRGAA